MSERVWLEWTAAGLPSVVTDSECGRVSLVGYVALVVVGVVVGIFVSWLSPEGGEQ